jgi:hypothetical protein
MKKRESLTIVVVSASLFLVLACKPAMAAVPAKPFSEVLKDEYRIQHDQLSKDLRRLTWFETVAAQTFNQEALVTEKDRDPTDIVLRRTRALLADLDEYKATKKLEPLAQALAALENRVKDVPVADKQARRAIYDEVCALRRKIATANPLLDFDSILFAKHDRARANHMCDQYFGYNAQPGGGIFVLEDAFTDQPRTRDLLADAVVQSGRLEGRKLAGGSFLQPQLSYDGGQILFSYTQCDRSAARWSPEKSYHVFRVDSDGSNLVQLTDGSWNDLHPNWMPDGRIVFMSERRGGFGRCHARPVPLTTLHTMDADGRNLMRISHHEANEWHPSIDNNGMIVYTRWDYVDRGHNQAHHPWVTTPDGRDARALHGNFKDRHDDNPDMEMNVSAIPESGRYVATAAPHHGQAYGSLVIINPSARDDNAMAPVRRLTPDAGFVETREKGPQIYGTAWPLAENYYLCVYDRGGGKYGIYLIDAFGNRELLYGDPEIACLGPVPLKPRRVPPRIPAVGEPTRLVNSPTYDEVGAEHALDPNSLGMSGMGVVGVVDVYDSLHPFPDDTKIESLRILQVLPKSTFNHHKPQIGYGCETGARTVLGTVPVEADGSAHFYLPAAKDVFFQAIDNRGLAVQSMRSATYVHAGEKLVCAGCHNRKEQSPFSTVEERGIAFRRTPSRITPEVADSNPLSYPRLVQPVLDKHCVECHAKSADKPKAIDLAAGDWQKNEHHWYTSYRNLYPYAFHFGAKFNPGYDGWTTARTIPGKFGARASKLVQLLDKGHYDVKLSPEEFHRITLWLDCNSDFFGAYEDTESQARGEVVKPTLQ